MWRVLQAGLGPLGVRVVRDIERRGLGRIVAAVDPAFEGQSLGSVVGGSASEVAVRGSLEAALEDAPVGVDIAVVTTASDLSRVADTLKRLADRGIDTVSTCEELSYPALRHPGLTIELDSAARQGGCRLLGTGVNPGFLMETLPMMISGTMNSVSHVLVERIQDASPRRIPFQRKIGAGLSPEEFEQRVQAGTLRHVGLGESLHLLCDAVGWRVERWDETIAPVMADREIDSGVGPVRPGLAAGVRQVAIAHAGGREVARLVFQAAVGQSEPRDRTVLTPGNDDPAVEVTIPGALHGDIATSAITLNSIAPLKMAAPGLHTMATIPPVRFGRGA